MPFENAKWIWRNAKPETDEYVLFTREFLTEESFLGLRICAETNYLAYLNGNLVGYGQFAGYPSIKYYDEIDISAYVKKGKNLLEITVWYEGFDSFTHIDDGAGLIFEVYGKSGAILCSDKNAACARDMRYIGNQKRLVTVQLGYTSGMRTYNGGLNFGDCVEIERKCNFIRRPVKKIKESPLVYGKSLQTESGIVYDLGREEVGYLSISLECEKPCTVTVSYGEYLLDGKIQRIISGGYKNAGRDFSLDLICTAGINKFENRFLRLAGRYLHVDCDYPVKVLNIGLIPVYYPVTEKPFTALKGVDKDVYDVCVRTLRLCMHEHYEDCPWREQALYSLDSRNQMLCGYYAFNESEFARGNLVFMAKCKRQDGLLELTAPARNTPAIPFFSLIFIVAVYEYVTHTGDITVLDELFDHLIEIANVFVKKINSYGLIENFGKPYWNFYEWAADSSNETELDDSIPRTEKTELILNCAFVYSMNALNKLCSLYNREKFFDTENTANAIRKTFYVKNKNLYKLNDVNESFSQLGNAFAVLIGLGNDGIIDAIKNDANLIPATLSMAGFVYDALLTKDGNRDFILNDIRRKYKYMLDNGATSFWEELGGASRENTSCSLCHGWSALPIYYYHILFDGTTANSD